MEKIKEIKEKDRELINERIKNEGKYEKKRRKS